MRNFKRNLLLRILPEDIRLYLVICLTAYQRTPRMAVNRKAIDDEAKTIRNAFYWLGENDDA